VDQTGDTVGDSGRVYRLGSTGSDRQRRPAGGGGRRPRPTEGFLAAAASLRVSGLVRNLGVVSGFTVRNTTSIWILETFPFPFPSSRDLSKVCAR
jgi:hypothetical protein